MYQTVYNLIVNYVWGSGAVLTDSQLVATDIFAVTACLLVLALPLYIVYRILRML